MPVIAAHQSSPRFVGRQTEVHLVDKLLGRVATEGGAAIVISGEAGIGKTFMAREVLARATGRGFLAVEGGASPLHRNIAYGPIVQALDRGLRTVEPADRGRLVSDLPALGALFMGLGLPFPEPLGNAALERSLFQAVARLIDRMSRRAPLAILMDDLQWFDDDSVSLLAFLTADLSGLPVLLVGTLTTPEWDGGRPGKLGHLLRALRGIRDTIEIGLAPMSEDELRALAQELLGGQVSDDLVELLATHSAGIPLFATALVDTLRGEGIIRHDDGVWTLPRAVDVPTHR